MYDHTKRVSNDDIAAALSISTGTVQNIIRSQQNMQQDMLSVIWVKLKGDVEVDGTRSGKNKKHQGVTKGRRNESKFFILAQPRESQRLGVVLSDNRHENCADADLLIPLIEKGSTVFTDGGHSRISAWNHFDRHFDRKTCNHSKAYVSPEGHHINTVEGRNKHFKGFNKHKTKSMASMTATVSEYLYRQWFAPRQGHLFWDCLMLYFAMWVGTALCCYWAFCSLVSCAVLDLLAFVAFIVES